MTSELKLVVESAADAPMAEKHDVGSMNPIDALNRRDIELIKKSLAGMHRNNTDLRSAMIALHQRDAQVPSRRFFITMGVIGFVAVSALAVLRPQVEAAVQRVPMLARLSADASVR